MSEGECEVIAVVREARRNSLTVETEADGACASCGAQILCGSKAVYGTAKTNTLTVARGAEFKKGDRVRLTVPAKFLLSVTFVLYAAGVAAGFSLAALLSSIFHISEVTAALVFLAAVAIWFVNVTIFSGKFVKDRIKISKIHQ